MPLIKNCSLYIGNDTGWLHISSGLGVKCVALFMDSPVQAYGKYSKNINIIVPEGETEETTTHDTLGANRISFDQLLISRRFSSFIYKEDNVYGDRAIKDYKNPGLESILESERIKKEILDFEQDLWNR